MIARVVNYHSTAELNSCLQLREFPKNSRIFAAFECGANRAPQFSSLVDRSFTTALAFDKLMTKL